jgi:hypothetical protein
MYADTKPCQVCGSDVELRPREVHESDPSDGPVGPADGVVGTADPTVDERVCTNPACPTRSGDGTP